jgi:hypothetical protein
LDNRRKRKFPEKVDERLLGNITVTSGYDVPINAPVFWGSRDSSRRGSRSCLTARVVG